jgi:thiosulfate/3-mercaptopyruvate sulfurtransferase
MLIEPAQLLAGHDAAVFDCRFALADPLEGRMLYEQGHIPGAHYLDLNRDTAGGIRCQIRSSSRRPWPDSVSGPRRR